MSEFKVGDAVKIKMQTNEYGFPKINIVGEIGKIVYITKVTTLTSEDYLIAVLLNIKDDRLDGCYASIGPLKFPSPSIWVSHNQIEEVYNWEVLTAYENPTKSKEIG